MAAARVSGARREPARCAARQNGPKGDARPRLRLSDTIAPFHKPVTGTNDHKKDHPLPDAVSVPGYKIHRKRKIIPPHTGFIVHNRQKAEPQAAEAQRPAP